LKRKTKAEHETKAVIYPIKGRRGNISPKLTGKKRLTGAATQTKKEREKKRG